MSLVARYLATHRNVDTAQLTHRPRTTKQTRSASSPRAQLTRVAQTAVSAWSGSGEHGDALRGLGLGGGVVRCGFALRNALSFPRGLEAQQRGHQGDISAG